MTKKYTYINRKCGLNSYIVKIACIELLGGKCVLCNTTEKLEFDHIDPSTKVYNITNLFAKRYKKLLVIELAKCQLLCEKCHLIKTMKYLASLRAERHSNKIKILMAEYEEDERLREIEESKKIRTSTKHKESICQ